MADITVNYDGHQFLARELAPNVYGFVTDPAGTTIQPVSGTVTATQGAAGTANWPVLAEQGDAGTANWLVLAAQGDAGTANWPVVADQGDPGTANWLVIAEQGDPGTASWPVGVTGGTIEQGAGGTSSWAVSVTGGTVVATQGAAGTANWPTIAAQGAAGTADWPVVATQGTAGTASWLVGVTGGTIQQGAGGTSSWAVNVTGGTVTAAQGAAGTAEWLVVSSQGDAGTADWLVIARQGEAGTSSWLVTSSGGTVTAAQGAAGTASWLTKPTGGTVEASQGAAGTANWLVTATQGAAGTAAWPVDGPLADDAAFTPATSKVFPIGALADETSPDSVDEGDLGALRMTLSRILWVALRGKNAASADKEIATDSNGNLQVSLSLGNSGIIMAQITGHADGESNDWNALRFKAGQYAYNGTTWDRARNNISTTLLASAARTAAATANLTNYNHRGILIVVDVTARAAATTLTPKLTLKGPVSGTYDLDFWTVAAAINTADGTFAYLFYPAETPAAITFTEEINVSIPRDVQLTVTPNDANSVTYSVGVYYLL